MFFTRSCGSLTGNTFTSGAQTWTGDPSLKFVSKQSRCNSFLLTSSYYVVVLFLGERIWSACNELRMFSGRRFQDIFSLLESCRTNVRSDTLAERSEDHLQQGHAHAFACKQHQCDRLHLGKQTPLSRGSFHCDVATLITIVAPH